VFRSTHEQEHDVVISEGHISKVWPVIESKFEHYFSRFVESCQPATSPTNLALKLGGKFKIKVVGHAHPGHGLDAAFRSAVDCYEREAGPYRNFFAEEMLQEYEELNAIEFKRALMKRQNCPIVANCVSSQREEMHEWQRKFAARDPRELRGVFRELFIAQADYSSVTDPKDFAQSDSWENLKLDWFDDDENLRAEGVVGTNIKSTVLYYLKPDMFPLCDADALFALYFLSGQGTFGLTSDSSEFVMINDQKSNSHFIDRMDRNYWYPYPLFALYQLRLYRLLEAACAKIKVELDPKFRFVYSRNLMQHIVGGSPECELIDAMRPIREDEQ
jgi:hypothetical protein